MSGKAKVALITGSGRKRVGYVIAKHLAQAGYNIAIHYHSSEEEAEENVAELRSFGSDVRKFQADVTDESAVESLVRRVVDEFGSLDLLVTTSSIWKSISLDDVTAKDVLDSFRVNTLGTFLCCQHAGRRMVQQELGGNIVTIGDSLIDHPYLDHAAYFTAKGAIPTLTRTFAVELGSRNPKVRVNCIEPGPVMFPEDMPKATRASRIASTLSKSADKPNEVASTVLHFASNSMLTGCCISLDGGRNVAQEHHARTRDH